MRKFYSFTVDDIGLDGYSTEKQLNNILDFCDAHKIKATLFVVPEANNKKISKRFGYLTILRDAIKRGHEVAQHGLNHERFEIGIPPEMILMLPNEAPARKFLIKNRDKLSLEHTVKKIREKLRIGRKILENAIEVSIKGFRSPALQFCENMFIALAEEGYEYDSSRYLQKAGWDLLNGITYKPQKITLSKFDSLKKTIKIKEYPLTTDYTWYLKKENFNKALTLAIHDYDACMTVGIPYVSLCHVGPITEGDTDLGFELYRRLFKHIKAKSLTLLELNNIF